MRRDEWIEREAQRFEAKVELAAIRHGRTIAGEKAQPCAYLKHVARQRLRELNRLKRIASFLRELLRLRKAKREAT